MSFDFSTLVTDRNQGDLEALRSLLATPLADWTAEQLEKFKQAVSKGAYNYTDLNRVTACMDDLNGRLTAAGYVTGYHPIIISHKATAPESLLPDGYIELEYIESTGTQYIDTGFKPNQSTKVILDMEPTVSPSNDWALGVRQSTNVDSYGVIFGSATSITSWYGTASSVQTIPRIMTRFVLNKNKQTVTITYQNGNITTISNGSEIFSCQYTLFLFNINLAGNPASARMSAKLYNAKIYDNDVLVRNYVPCKNPSGKIGLYDLVSQEFYENSGSGMFLAGPEIPKPDPDPALDPIWYEDDTPTTTQMSRFLQNVSALRSVLKLPEDTAPVPSDMVGLTLTEANNIESILDVLQDWIINMQAAWFFSGDLYSGEV